MPLMIVGMAIGTPPIDGIVAIDRDDAHCIASVDTLAASAPLDEETPHGHRDRQSVHR